MSSEETETAPISFQVIDSAGVQSTLELVETFRLQVKGKLRDYCLVRPLAVSGASQAAPCPDGPVAMDAGGEGAADDEAADVGADEGELQAYRLEDNGLASLEPGEETILLGQALLALQNVALMDDEEEDEADEGEEESTEPRPRH